MKTYEHHLTRPGGGIWSARACARPYAGGWEGWIEFLPLSAVASPVRSARETTQPDRGAIEYWANGITETYLEGALARALGGPVHVAVPEPVLPLFDGPAPAIQTGSAGHAPKREAILDPFSVYAHGGEDLLLAQLGALDVEHVRGIAVACELAPPDVAAAASKTDLMALIVAGVRNPETSSASTPLR